MSKDDYYVIAYRILDYLYERVKAGARPDFEFLCPDSYAFPVNGAYWEYIFFNLQEDGYIRGVRVVPVLGYGRAVKLTSALEITPKGIAYLDDNSAMQRAKAFLKGIKDTVPMI